MTAKLDPHGDQPPTARPRAWCVYGSNGPNYSRQDGDPVQDQRPLRPADERHLGGAGADRQQHHHAAPTAASTRTPASSTPTGNALWLRAAYDGTERDLHVLARRHDVHTSRRRRCRRSAFGASGRAPRSACSPSTTAAARPRPSSSTRSPSRPRAAAARTRRRRARPTCSPRRRRTATAATTSPTSRSRSTRPTTTAARASINTEYREQGAATWTAYSAPFNVTTDGTHTIEYRSIDKKGNVESTRTVDVQDRQDGPGDQRQAQRRGAEGELHR